jgi:hypothetical protein
MALASFFDKTALAAAQVLGGFDLSAFQAALQSQVICVAFDREAARSPEASNTLQLAVNLLSRLYPRLAIAPLDAEARAVSHELVAHSLAINPAIEITDDLSQVSACIVVGLQRPQVEAPVVFAGSDGWVVHLSSSAPVGIGTSKNPFGAGAAACLAVANIFRITFAGQLPHSKVDETVRLSLVDYDPSASQPSNHPLRPVDLGESYLVGLGAIGNGAVWALGKLKSLRGKLHLIDHETVDLSNLQRYVLAKQADADAATPKADLAAHALSGTGLVIDPHRVRWGQFLRTRSNWDLQRVAVAVDSARDRQAIQAALPRWITNAWTQPDALGVSTHQFIGDSACLMCLYLPDAKQLDLDVVIAQAIGLPDAIREVREMLYRHTPINRQWIDRIATARGISSEPLLGFEGKTLDAFYRQAVCGGVLLRLGSNPNTSANAEAPMAFQSALAGIMLAAELVLNADSTQQADRPDITTINLLRPLGTHLSQPRKKSPTGRCICQDQGYVQRYMAKYS